MEGDTFFDRAPSGLSDASEKAVEHHLRTADAFEAFAVVAALVFGFSMNSLITVLCEFKEESASVPVATFCVLLAIASVFSGFATVFMTLEVYYLYRMADNHELRLQRFLQYTAKGRLAARNATYVAISAIFTGVAVLSWDLVGGGSGFAYAMAALLGLGALVVITTAVRLHGHAARASSDASRATIGERLASLSLDLAGAWHLAKSCRRMSVTSDRGATSVRRLSRSAPRERESRVHPSGGTPDSRAGDKS